MNHFQLKSAIATVLILSMLTLSLAHAAPPPKVLSANPNFALQGETLNVDIGGSNLEKVVMVRFLVTGTDDASQISVGAVSHNEDGTLTASVQVEGEALVSEYDIEAVETNGRRGKGTTLFSVLSNDNGGGQNNLPQISCDELFGFTTGTCTAEGTSDPCMFEETLDEAGHVMLQHCDTRDMLIVGSPQYKFLNGGGYRLNLVAPWSGAYAGITNTQGASRIDSFHVRVADPAVASGCGGAGTVQVAVYFDPDLPPVSSVPRSASSFHTVEALGGARFCNGIELVGSDPIITHPYKETHTIGNHVMANSYERAGIWVANINQSDIEPGNPETARIEDNVVEPSTAPCAVGILIENVERPTVHDNVVFASNGTGCADNTAGIIVSDSGRNKVHPTDPNYDFNLAEPASLVGNTVMTGGGGSIGIVINSTTDAVMTNSTLSAGDGTDIGVCVETGADLVEKKKPSSYVGFDPGHELVFAADCGAALP